MKYIAFAMAAIVGIPAMTIASMVIPKIKYLLVSMLILSIMFGSMVSINFVSMEQYRGPSRGFEITVTDLICLALIFTLILTKPKKIIWIPKTFGMCAVFFVAAVINVVSSPVPLYGYFFLWQLYRAALLYWCIINLVVTEDGGKEIMNAIWMGFVAVGCVMLLIAFKQKYVDGIYRIPAFFDHSNTVPSFLIMLLCATMVWGMANKEFTFIQYAFTMIASLGMIFAIFATGSRSGYLVAAGSVGASLVITNFRKKKLAVDRFRIVFSTIVIIVAMFVGGLLVIDTVIDRFLNAPESSEEARDEFNISARMMAEDHFFGVGLNQFSYVLTNTEKYREHIKIMANEEQAGVAHHIYLLTAAEMGNIGLALFLLLLARILVPIAFTGLRWKNLNHLILLGLTTGLLSLLMIGFLEWVFRLTPVIYQFSLASGLGIGLVILDKRARKSTTGE